MSPTDPRTRIFFAVAALWNVSAALVAILAPDFHAESFYGVGADLGGPVGSMNNQAVWVSVLLFGIGYGIVARDPTRNHGIVWLGALGKVYVFAVWVWAYSQGHAQPLVLVGAIGDLSFAALFAWFLWRAHAESASSS